MMPRITGRRGTRWRAMPDWTGRETWAISPFGVRTATAQLPGPRIITPSRTACPPMLLMRWLAVRRGRALGPLGALQLLLEALHPAAGVHELLLARVERVAVRADLDVEIGLRRPRLERVPAGAGHGREDVLGLDFGLHDPARIAAACRGPTLPPEITAATFWPDSSRAL